MNKYTSLTNDFSDPKTIEKTIPLNPLRRPIPGVPDNYQLSESLAKLFPGNDYDPRMDIELWDDK